MNETIKKHNKEIKLSIALVVIALVLSFVLEHNYDNTAAKIEEEKNENITSKFSNIDVDMEYNKDEGAYSIVYSNSTLLEIIDIKFDMYYDGVFYKTIEFEDSVSANEYSNKYYLHDLNLNPNKCKFITREALYINNDVIYGLKIEDDYTIKTRIGKMPYAKENKARYLIPKVNIRTENKENYIYAYIYNITNYEIVDYEFIYSDSEDGIEKSISFGNIKSGEKSSTEKGIAPKSGLIKDLIPNRAYITIYNKDGEKKNLLYEFSSGLILDIEKYENLLANN